MENEFISLSTLNDFIFCPYSIYFHNVYMGTNDDFYHATPQIRGNIAHEAVDEKRSSTRKDELLAMPVFCKSLGITGKIDVYRGREKHLIERKYQLKQIYQGQYYQLWGQYFCMIEMGYEIERLSFYEIYSNRTIPVNLPGQQEYDELKSFILKFQSFNINEITFINPNKCCHCIYNPVCHLAPVENVY